MGKGDKKTRRGKILMGSHGVRRPRRKHGRNIPLVALKEEKPAASIKEKAPAKPKPPKEEQQVDTPVITDAPVAVSEEVVKPARKKAPPKGSPKNEAT